MLSSGSRYVTFQTLSALFGGAADKYLPMSAVNGMRIIFSLEDVAKCYVINGLKTITAGAAVANSVASVTISDPTFFMNMVRVDPTVDAQLISAATGGDGNIRIHSQTYNTFQYAMTPQQSTWEQIIPIKVSSLKAVLFTFAPQSNYGWESFTQQDNILALASFADTTANSKRVMKTSWF